ncbi:alpha/beta fold hydrolase, partial [Georgenia sp. 10Sc9-8]|nr:alpha/beta fold hydrolase [Georgenia halotolerans]
MELRRTVTWRGRTVAWDTVGSGPPVVMCHGTPWSSALWAPFAHALAAEFTVYLWDMPGYGQSSKGPADAVDLGVQGELLAHLLTTWGLGSPHEPPHVVAHDYGGAVALRSHLLHGARYASLCLVDVVALRPWGSDFFRLVRHNADAFATLPPAVHQGVVEAYI